MKVDISVDKNKYDVKIDSDDLWSLDFTLSKIIHPALVRFKEEETGSGAIDKEDVPEHLHDTYGSKEELAQNHSHEAWHWVLDEMIWTFNSFADEQQAPRPYNGDEFKAWADRRRNGLRLFGKYFQTLWN